MRRQVDGWLRRDDPGHIQLIDWLQGCDLPDPNEEGCVWLLRGIRPGRPYYETAVKVAGRLADLLREQPDVRTRGERPNQVLYNLLSLCAALDYPDQLAEPLHQMLARRALKGKYRGWSLRPVLLAALIRNQIDTRSQSVWKKMLEGKRHNFLGGTRFDGFDGILRTPAASRGEPDVDEIGSALAVMARYLEPDRDRRNKFDDLLDQVMTTYPRSDWDRLLLETAHKQKWPQWAARRLPKFFIRVGPSRNHTANEVYAPEPVAQVTHEIHRIDPGKEYLAGLVRKMSLPHKPYSLVSEISPVFDQNRLNDPSIRDESASAVDDYTLLCLELHFYRKAGARRLAEVIKEVRVKRLRQKKIGISLAYAA